MSVNIVLPRWTDLFRLKSLTKLNYIRGNDYAEDEMFSVTVKFRISRFRQA